MALREHTVHLVDGTLHLRPMTEEDWPILLRWNNDPEVLYFCEGDDITSWALADMQAMYRGVSQHAFVFMAELDGAPIGECWLQEMNLPEIVRRHRGKDVRRIDLSIGEKALWGRGIGTRIIALLTRFAFESCGADLVYEPGIANYNIRSRRAFQKNGYITYEIKLLPTGCKARCDYHLYITRERFNALKEATMNASDLREEFKYSLRASDKKVTLVDMPALPFLMFDGAGDPNTSPDFQDGINALYSLTYTAKFTLKARDPALDFSVMTLDGLWSTARPEDIYEKSKLSWTLLMMQPRWMTPQLVEEMKAEVARKRPLEALAHVRLETFAEGLAAQILHIGPYDSEHETVNRLTEWMSANGYEQNGRHHEIYLSDPRRVPPEKYRTIIRHPVKTITA